MLREILRMVDTSGDGKIQYEGESRGAFSLKLVATTRTDAALSVG